MQRSHTTIGARLKFIKVSVVSSAAQQTDGSEEILLHTGQHFDANMSEIIFNHLGITRPDIHYGKHGEMTGRMLISRRIDRTDS